MDLILWRHAEAEDGINDLQRQLTPRGQTAQALGTEFRICSDINPGCEAAAILAACNWGESNETVVVVGHQPTLGRLASFLLAGSEMEWSVKKSSVWWISNRVRQSEPQTYLKAALLPELM